MAQTLAEAARALLEMWDSANEDGPLNQFDAYYTLYRGKALFYEALRSALEADDWQPIESAPKGHYTELITDPEWVEPPMILLGFGTEGVSDAYWDWYYAEGGAGCTNGFAWIEPCSGEPLNLHYSTPPTHWRPLPPPPQDAKL